MRAEIEIKEHEEKVKDGWFSSRIQRTWQVYPHVTFTDDEKKTLTKFQLWDRVAYEYKPTLRPEHAAVTGGGPVPLTIKQIAQPNFFLGTIDPVIAKRLATTFEEEILPLIKNYINGVAGPTQKRVVDL